MTEIGEEAAVRVSLDGALEDLLRSAVEVGPEPYADSCARIDATLDRHMISHQQLGWAMDETATLKRALKHGLHIPPYRSGDESSEVGRS